MLGAAFQPVTYLELDDDNSAADEPPVQVLPDDLPSSQTSYGRADYRRFLNAETIVYLNDSANSGTAGDVIEELGNNPPADSGQSSALPLLLLGAAAFLIFRKSGR